MIKHEGETLFLSSKDTEREKQEQKLLLHTLLFMHEKRNELLSLFLSFHELTWNRTDIINAQTTDWVTDWLSFLSSLTDCFSWTGSSGSIRKLQNLGHFIIIVVFILFFLLRHLHHLWSCHHLFVRCSFVREKKLIRLRLLLWLP